MVSNDELGTLTDNFNKMVGVLRDKERMKVMELELEQGRKIQRDFLPKDLLLVPGWEIDADFFPARQVSGDFYDAFELPDGNVAFVIADVCDKGVGSALFMALFRSLLRVYTLQLGMSAWMIIIMKPRFKARCTRYPTPMTILQQCMGNRECSPLSFLAFLTRKPEDWTM